MPVVLVLLLVAGGFILGSFVATPNLEPVIPESIAENTAAPTPFPILGDSRIEPQPIPVPLPTTNPTPDPQVKRKQEQILELSKKIAGRYTALKHAVTQVKKEGDEIVKCNTTVREEAEKEFSQPFQGDLYHSPDTQRNLVEMRVRACITPHQTLHDYWLAAVGPAENDIKDMRNQLYEISESCSSCESLYKTAISKFDEIENQIRSIN